MPEYDKYKDIQYNAEKGYIRKGGTGAFDLKKGQSGYNELVSEYKTYQNQQREAASKNVAANTKIRKVVENANNNQDLLTNTRHPSRFPETTQVPKHSNTNPEITSKVVKKNIKKTD